MSTDQEAAVTTPDAPEATPPSDDAPQADPATFAQAVEALLMSCDRPLPAAKAADAIGATLPPDERPTTDDIAASIELLNTQYEQTGRAFRIEFVSGGFRVMSLPEHASVLAAFHKQRSSTRLSRAGLETLAVIAYKQPVTRARLEAIRGVACGEVLKTLLERRLIAVVGRAEELGRPMLYGTTKQFLDAFGLASIKDLPDEKNPRGLIERTEG